MNYLKRPAVLIPLVIAGFLVAVAAGATGAYLALKPSSSSDSDETFTTNFEVSAVLLGIDGYTARARQCIMDTTQAGTIQAGTPVTIEVEGETVGTSELSVGRYKASTESYNPAGICLYTVSAEIDKKVEAPEGKYPYEITIGDSLWHADYQSLQQSTLNIGIG